MQQFRNEFSVKVHVSTLLDNLKRNLALHTQQHEEALKNWRSETIAKAEKIKQRLNNGETPKFLNDFDPPPADMSEQYKLAISMVSMHDEQTLQLDQQQFNAFVNNIWDWSNTWSASNSKYLSNR